MFSAPLLLSFFILFLLFSLAFGSKIQWPTARTEITTGHLLFPLLIALYFTFFLRTAPTEDVSTLGINAFFFFALLFLWYYRRHPRLLQRMSTSTAAFLIGGACITLSFALYGNPFLAPISFVILVIAFFFVFTPYQMVGTALFSRHYGGYLMRLADGIGRTRRLLSQHRWQHTELVRRIGIGLSILFLLCAVIVFPLLMSADTDFSQAVKNLLSVNLSISGINGFFRHIVVGTVIFLFLAATLVYWTREHKTVEAKEPAPQDNVISVIILGGILCSYVAFLLFQLDVLFSPLPTENFVSVEAFVKGGFWQLFILTAFNAILFMLFYKRTSPLVQKVLGLFTLSSLLLVIAGAHRIYLYMVFHGLSYEKFFAGYTALYSFILFAWFLSLLVRHHRAHIARFIITSAFVLYGLVAILPIEKIIFHTNLALHTRPQSSILLYELQMLTSDVYGDVVREYETLIRQEKSDKTVDEQKAVWDEWLAYNKELLDDKKWYENNMTDLLVRKYVQ